MITAAARKQIANLFLTFSKVFRLAGRLVKYRARQDHLRSIEGRFRIQQFQREAQLSSNQNPIQLQNVFYYMNMNEMQHRKILIQKHELAPMRFKTDPYLTRAQLFDQQLQRKAKISFQQFIQQ